MSNELSIVDFDSLGIRWVEDDNGEKWFVIQDIFKLRNPNKIRNNAGRTAHKKGHKLKDLNLHSKFCVKYNIDRQIRGTFQRLYVCNIKSLIKILIIKNGQSENKTSEMIRDSLTDHLAKSLDKNFIDLWQALKEMDVSDLPPDRYVYVAREQVSGRYKIGISINPVERVKQLNIGNPELLELVHYYQACESGYLSEKMAHDLYEAHRLKGEWFDNAIDLTLLPEIVL